MLGLPVNKKLIFLAILLGAVIYFLGWDRINSWFSQSSVLGKRIGPAIEDRVLDPAKETVNHHVRWPKREDLEPLPRLTGNEDYQENNLDSANVDFDQSLETLTEDIKKLPQQQLIKVKEQLVKEIFPDCQCVCE